MTLQRPNAPGTAREGDAPSSDDMLLGWTVEDLADGGGAPHGQGFRFAVDGANGGRRLDVAVADAAKGRDLVLSRTRVKALIEAGHLTIDGVPVSDANHRTRPGEVVALVLPPAEAPEPLGEPIPLEVVFEDAHLVVIDKPAGLVVHPAPGHASGTLVNALIAHCGASLSGIGGVRRPGIVHRLDKDTSGLLVVAKTDAAHRGLARLFADHGRTLSLERTYLALVWGKPERPSGTVDAPVGRHAADRLRMAVVPDARGRGAITHWRIRESYGPADASVASLLACRLETGRTHQIRVHMAHVGHPVLGDPVYARGFRGKEGRLTQAAKAGLDALGRQALHAAGLAFAHPVTGAAMAFDSALPPDMRVLRTALRAVGP